MSAVIDSSTLAGRALSDIAYDLRSALSALKAYQLLMPEGSPRLDASNDDIQRKKALVNVSLRNAYVKSDAFSTVFFECAEYVQFRGIFDWTFELNFGLCLFRSVPDFIAAIQVVIDSIETGSILDKPYDMNWGLIS